MEALQLVQGILEEIAIPIDTSKKDQMLELIQASVGTKFVSRWGTMISELALEAARKGMVELPNGKVEVDLKRYARVEKIPGGELDECEVLQGVMFNKDVTHHKMRRDIKNPRVILIDCPLEYKKNESNTNVEITNESDWDALLKQEETEVQKLCEDIIKMKPDVVITEKGVSDLAQHFLLKANISVIRRIRKTDNVRVGRISGATIVHRPEELTEKDVGTGCGLFQCKKIGDEFFCFMTECKDPKACTIMLRGPSKDVLNEIERNLQDAFCVSRNILLEPKLLPGGGATEMEISCRLKDKAKSIEGPRQLAYTAVATALEVIPRTLAQNCGVDVVRTMTDLRARHATVGNSHIGIDGLKGCITDVRAEGIMDCFAVKQQTIKTSVESAAMLLRIDQVVSGIKRKQENKPQAQTSIADQAAAQMG